MSTPIRKRVRMPSRKVLKRKLSKFALVSNEGIVPVHVPVQAPKPAPFQKPIELEVVIPQTQVCIFIYTRNIKNRDYLLLIPLKFIDIIRI